MRFGTLLVLVALSVTCAAQDLPESSGDRSKVLALENAWGQAEKSGDIKALEGLLDNSLVYIRYDGKLWNKAQYLGSLKDPGSHEEQAVNEEMAAQMYENVALVTGIYRVKGTERGKAYLRRERFIDTWIHRGGGWVCVASQVTLISR
jgi:hypothetical protein